jgi:hypothetical protein
MNICQNILNLLPILFINAKIQVTTDRLENEY